ncbi:hypothetical protein LshimejAT787_0306320 [Lyophyllum shimeji]|uniref:Uncharacterized protein n=1 Tax=Lyophyllum shimeji TaxID=47721 RepID=A0A9P3PJ16_LYOSH|nr:hypothetical protein LshimejAT787_0306320 [Lyophyllum shimeji]
MDSAPTVIPQISISLAPPEEPVIEPYSPFSSTTLTPPSHDDGFRPIHLTPPPTLTKFGKPLSPLRPCDDTAPPKGLERERFEALLQASRERNALFGTTRAGDLRKEIALKAHKNKQVGRRALFLSKVLAPPSPTATLTPKTPPDSPAIFHYSLPSPGLVSPLAMFESLSANSEDGVLPFRCEPWVEQVDFRRLEDTKAKELGLQTSATRPGRPLPSLDQISARLNSQSHVRSRGDGANQTATFAHQTTVPERPRLNIGVGRLQMPVRAPKPALEPLLIPTQSPKSLRSPNLQVTTLVVPRSSATSPTELSKSNLVALASRERKAHDMLSTLRRRTLLLERASGEVDADGMDGRRSKWKRHSAPADLLPLRERSGFEHPVLALPGGF